MDAKLLQSCLTLQPHGLQPTRLLCPLDSSGKNTEVGCHFLLQGIFLSQGSNLHLLNCQAGSSPLVPPGKPYSDGMGQRSKTGMFSNLPWFHLILLLLLLLSCFSRVRLCVTHRRQPTRLPRPWEYPGKNTGVGCHFLLQYMKVKSESEVTQPCPTLQDPMDCSAPGSSIHGIFQARVLEWGAIAFSSPNSSQPLLHPKSYTPSSFSSVSVLPLSLLSQLSACKYAKSLQSCPALFNPMDCSLPAPLPKGFSMQEYCSGLLCLSPGDLPNSEIKGASPALAGRFFTTSTTWEALQLCIKASTTGEVSQ